MFWMLTIMDTKPRISRGIFTGLGISKKITDDWLILNNVVKKNAHSSVDLNSSISSMNKCMTSEIENVTGMSRLKALILGTSFLQQRAEEIIAMKTKTRIAYSTTSSASAQLASYQITKPIKHKVYIVIVTDLMRNSSIMIWVHGPRHQTSSSILIGQGSYSPFSSRPHFKGPHESLFNAVSIIF